MSEECHELSTRDDLVAWTRRLLPDPYAYPATSGSTYDEDIRRFEWAARPLWAVFSLMASGEYDERDVAPFIRRVHDGLDPAGPARLPRADAPAPADHRGDGGLWLWPSRLRGGPALPPERGRAGPPSSPGSTLPTGVELPWGGWFCSRALVNAGLAAAGLPYDAERLALDLRSIESMYAGGGWYENGRPFQRDHYIGLSFHFVLLLLRRFAPEACPLPEEPARAAEFEADYLPWFDRQGRSVPFGRSIFYRFGHACFWAAEALTGVHERPLGEVKRLIMQNLRWWHDHLEELANPLAPGYGYPNLALVEDYCSPASPLRALRSLVLLALPSEDEFWRVDEKDPEREAVRVEEGAGGARRERASPQLPALRLAVWRPLRLGRHVALRKALLLLRLWVERLARRLRALLLCRGLVPRALRGGA